MKIVVLMSTYNGEKYIRAQLDSILKQTLPAHILIRDDGSTDDTLNIVQVYINAGADVELIKGENVGVKTSFFKLIEQAPEADYYAFSDQDDYWLENKLQQAVEKLENEKKISLEQLPLLYCSDTYLVDNDLQIIKRENRNPLPSFGNALVENICTGCTAVMNKELFNKIRENVPNTDKIVMHDWWFYLIAEQYGKTVFDDEPQIYYRQHGNNEWGAKTKKSQVWKYRFKQLFGKRGQIYRQLEELESFIGKNGKEEITKQQYNLLLKVLDSEKSFLGKCRLFKDKAIYRNDASRDRVYRLAMMVGKL